MTAYYVRQDGGSNSRDGKSWKTAWSSLKSALQKVSRGDTIHVAKGVYDAIVNDKPNLKLYGYGAVIDGRGAAHHGVLNFANWFLLNGFEVRNANGGGVCTNTAYNVTVENCFVHHNRGHGISLIKGDYFRVRGNTVADNIGVAGRRATCGISIFNPRPLRRGPFSPWRIAVVGNTVCRNDFDGATDGCGILFDCFVGRNAVPYNYPSLIQWNKLYNNGNAGFFLFHTKDVQADHNWCYHNAQNTRKKHLAEISFNYAENSNILQNTVEAEPGKFALCTGGMIPNVARFDGNRMLITGEPDNKEVVETFKHWNHSVPSESNNIIGGDPPLWWRNYWSKAA